MLLSEIFPYWNIIQELSKEQGVDVYLIGGFIRDFVLNNIKTKDFDFSLSDKALDFAQLFANKINGAYVLLDEDNKCARVVKKQKGNIITYDFANFRAKSLKEDLKHRDFTINTLCVDINDLSEKCSLTDKIQDHQNGLQDIECKKIVMNSHFVFDEDPLRIMRAFSLKAQLGFDIDSNTLQEIKGNINKICNVSMERVREELFKVLLSSNAFEVLSDMDELGLLVKIIPQIHIMQDCHQGGYHHLDVWKHSLEAVRQVEEVLAILTEEINCIEDLSNYLDEYIAGGHKRIGVLRLACLLHDIGKPETKEKKGDRYSFHSHENLGARVVKHVNKLLKLSRQESFAIEQMVKLHLRPGYLSDLKDMTERSIYRFFRDAKNESVSILILSLSDQRATRGPLTTQELQDKHKEVCLKLIDKYFEDKKRTPIKRLVTGNDLIKHFKLKPSPTFKIILENIEEQQVLQNLTDKEKVMLVAKDIIKSYDNKENI